MTRRQGDWGERKTGRLGRKKDWETRRLGDEMKRRLWRLGRRDDWKTGRKDDQFAFVINL